MADSTLQKHPIVKIAFPVNSNDLNEICANLYKYNNSSNKIPQIFRNPPERASTRGDNQNHGCSISKLTSLLG